MNWIQLIDFNSEKNWILFNYNEYYSIRMNSIQVPWIQFNWYPIEFNRRQLCRIWIPFVQLYSTQFQSIPSNFIEFNRILLYSFELVLLWAPTFALLSRKKQHDDHRGYRPRWRAHLVSSLRRLWNSHRLLLRFLLCRRESAQWALGRRTINTLVPPLWRCQRGMSFLSWNSHCDTDPQGQPQPA